LAVAVGGGLQIVVDVCFGVVVKLEKIQKRGRKRQVGIVHAEFRSFLTFILLEPLKEESLLF